MKEITEKEFEDIFISLFLEDEKRLLKMHGFPIFHVMDFELMQKELWDKHHINRPQFLKLFERFYHNQPHPSSNEIYTVNISGGPCNSYKKRNWAEVDGRHYVVFRIYVNDYLRMRKEGK